MSLVFFPRAASSAPTADSSAAYLRGLVHERFGDARDAAAFYERAAALDPDSLFLRETLVGLYLQLKRLEDALREAETLVRLAPKDPASFIVLGRVRLARGERDLSRRAFDDALALAPAHGEALLYSAFIRSEDQPREALAFYRRYLDENPDSVDALIRIAELQQSLRDPEAERTWRRALEMDPSSFPARFALGRLREAAGDLPGALEEYRECRFLRPENPDILIRLGELSYRARDYPASREAFERALQLVPGDASALFGLALLAEEEGDWAAAADRMRRVVPLSDDPGVSVRLAYYYSQDGREKSAYRVLHRLVRRRPDNPDFIYYLALSCQELGKLRAAARWFQRAVDKDPVRPEAHFHLGAVWERLGRLDLAEPSLLRAIELNPRHAAALNYLGYSWADRDKNLPEALEYIRRAVALNPDSAAYQDSLGWVQYRLGRLAEAETALSRAALAADDPLVWEHYGDLLLKAGREQDAVRAWQEGLLIDPKSPGLRRRLRGRDPMDRVRPRTAPRVLLKRVEGNFRQLRGLSGFVRLEGRAAGRPFQAEGVFYYAKPGLFRFEFLGPFLVPQALLVRNARGLRWHPPEQALSFPGQEEWLQTLGDVLSGELFARFDDPSVRVRRRGENLAYAGPAGDLLIHIARKTPTSLTWTASPRLSFSFRGHREVEGLLLPGAVDCRIPSLRLAFTLDLSRLQVNPNLSPGLFKIPDEK